MWDSKLSEKDRRRNYHSGHSVLVFELKLLSQNVFVQELDTELLFFDMVHLEHGTISIDLNLRYSLSIIFRQIRGLHELRSDKIR